MPDREFQRSDLRSVAFDRTTVQASTSQATIWLANGDRISARAMTVADDLLTVSWPALGNSALSQIPLEQVSAIIWEWPADLQERLRFLADIETLPPGNDLVMFANGDRSSGDFERLDAAHVELKVGANTLKLDRSRIRAVRFNPELTTLKHPAGRRMLLTLTDGSRLTLSSIELSDDQLNVHSALLGNRTLSIDSLVECHVLGERWIPLSDYEPARFEFTPYLSTTWPLVRNANVRRGPLKLRRTEHVTGLGMHSRMFVTYKLKGHEREFQATVGIDDLAGGGGSAVFGVELDGRRVWTSPELTGKSPALNVPAINLHGIQEITLLVEYGQFGDVLDYADWCDAALIVD